MSVDDEVAVMRVDRPDIEVRAGGRLLGHRALVGRPVYGHAEVRQGRPALRLVEDARYLVRTPGCDRIPVP
jgi:hypothetical protein